MTIVYGKLFCVFVINFIAQDNFDQGRKQSKGHIDSTSENS